MSDAKKVVLNACRAEITEKKSRFIAVCLPASSEEEALALISRQRKLYFDARHTCFAYVCGENNGIIRFSDDGEPHGTAGKPILDVILGNNLKNTLIAVTRYFGGTLLGTGGLVRAYSSAAAMAVEEGLASGAILETARGAEVRVMVSYKDLGRFEHLCKSKNVQINDKEFGENVVFSLLVREEDIAALEKDTVNLTNGTAKIIIGQVSEQIFSI